MSRPSKDSLKTNVPVVSSVNDNLRLVSKYRNLANSTLFFLPGGPYSNSLSLVVWNHPCTVKNQVTNSPYCLRVEEKMIQWLTGF